MLVMAISNASDGRFVAWPSAGDLPPAPVAALVPKVHTGGSGEDRLNRKAAEGTNRSLDARRRALPEPKYAVDSKAAVAFRLLNRRRGSREQ